MNKALAIVFILTTLIFTTSVFGQTLSDSGKPNKYVYCELTPVQIGLSHNVHVIADFGDDTKGLGNQKLNDEKTGKPKVFNSMVDALNCMSELGWEVVNVYATVNSTCTYLLRKIKT